VFRGFLILRAHFYQEKKGRRKSESLTYNKTFRPTRAGRTKIKREKGKKKGGKEREKDGNFLNFLATP